MENLKKHHRRNTIEYEVSGDYALFSDPVLSTGGEKTSLPIPTYQALKEITKSIYWKPTITWYVDAVRIINPIQMETKGMIVPKFKGGNDLASYTYLKDVRYQVRAHFEFNKNHGELACDWEENKHYQIAKRMVEAGGRRDIFLGCRECAGDVEPCTFGSGESYYDSLTKKVSYGFMYHGKTYADEAVLEEEKDKLTVNFWNPVMEPGGIIRFIRPERCQKRMIHDMDIKVFGDNNFSGLSEFSEWDFDSSIPDNLEIPEEFSGFSTENTDQYSWKADLLSLYDRNSSEAGKIHYREYKQKNGITRCPYTLLPIFHTTVGAQIEVRLDVNGKLLDITEVPLEDKVTIIPSTAEAESRSSNLAPYPLCDTLTYLADGLERYVGDSKGKKACTDAHRMYMEQLALWENSSFVHPKVHAIYQYLDDGSMVDDLLKYKILHLDASKHLDAKQKIQRTDQRKCFVRFVVMDGSEVSECWLDQTLQENYIQYVRSQDGEKQLDYLAGDQQVTSCLHPKKIVNDGSGGKLISTNDEETYTYRGTLRNKSEVLSIGYENSQKIHNALRWLMRKQGRTIGDYSIVAWESHMNDIPAWDSGTQNIVSKIDAIDDSLCIVDQPLGDPVINDIVLDENPLAAEQFYQALAGYQVHLHPTSEMIVMAFYAATPGRIAMTTYEKMKTSDYLENIKKWHETCAWLQPGRYYGIPSVKEIARLLYGIESNDRMELSGENGKKTEANVTRQLFPCIANGNILPHHYVLRSVILASAPTKYTNIWNWRKILALACSFVKKEKYDRKKEKWIMKLDTTITDRNYLYGRLLAVADRIESQVSGHDSNRLTNAKRYMTAFSQHPYQTWKILEEQIIPYQNKLSRKDQDKYQALIDEIMVTFESVKDFRDNTALDGLYLLGYHCQSFTLNK